MYDSPMKRVLMSWSSGKDSAWALHLLRRDPTLEIVGLLTTLNTEFQRVAMHGTRRSVLEAQAEAAQLPLWVVPLPWPCSNEIYEQRMAEVCDRAIGEGVDAILTTVSGCGTTMKDYGFMFRAEPDVAGDAARVSGLVRDISEFISEIKYLKYVVRRPLAVAYHAACSLQHGQKITALPKDMLSKAGFAVTDIPEGHICCGSAGTYNVLQPELANRLRDRKIAHIQVIAPDLIAAGNIGCITQIAAGIGIPVVHPIELIDWATGGPAPRALESKGRPM